MPDFHRFTERARQVVALGQDEARLLKHNYIGTEHLLLGLLREEEGLASRVLGAFDVTLHHVREQVRQIISEGDVAIVDGQIPFTPRASKVLELALREALSLGHNYIGTEHILLGLIRDNGGVASRILNEAEATPERIRNEIVRSLSRRRWETRPAPLAALRDIVNVLGPVAGCPHIGCEGCQAELAAALEIARQATT